MEGHLDVHGDQTTTRPWRQFPLLSMTIGRQTLGTELPPMHPVTVLNSNVSFCHEPTAAQELKHVIATGPLGARPRERESHGYPDHPSTSVKR
jgi:hypothetical protein